MAEWSYKLAEDGGPACEPVRLSALKEYLRLPDDGGEDDTLAMLLSAGRQYVEAFTGRALITQTLVLSLDAFPSSAEAILLTRCPVQSVDAITYDAGDTDEQGAPEMAEMDDGGWTVDTADAPCRLVPAYNTFWPTDALYRPGAVQIEFTAGYGDTPDDVPSQIRLAIMQYAALRYEQRLPDLTEQQARAIDLLLFPYRLWGTPV